MHNRTIQALSMARRAGKLEVGFDATDKAIKKKRAALVVVADDIAARTLRNTERAADGRVEILRLPFAGSEFEAVFRRRFVVAAVTDEGMAALVRKSAGGETI